MRYKAILMDADHTLLDFNAAEDQALKKLFERYGINAPEAMEVYKRINNACWAAYERGEMTQEALQYVRYERFFKELSLNLDARAVAENYNHLLSLQPDILPHADEVVRAIHEKLPVAIVTNGLPSIQHPRLRASAIFEWIDRVVISEEIGFRKPDPEIVRAALRAMRVENPADALFVGDSLTSDMPAARDAGVDFLWYNPSGRARPANAHITYEVRDVREFIPIATME